MNLILVGLCLLYVRGQALAPKFPLWHYVRLCVHGAKILTQVFVHIKAISGRLAISLSAFLRPYAILLEHFDNAAIVAALWLRYPSLDWLSSDLSLSVMWLPIHLVSTASICEFTWMCMTYRDFCLYSGLVLWPSCGPSLRSRINT